MGRILSMTQVLVLEPSLGLKEAMPLKTALIERRGQPLEIDASHVQRLGGLCLQVLLSARRMWADDHQPLTIKASSDAFGEAIRLFGAQAHFDPFDPRGEVR
jgi:chemotaxis protein CheX